MRHLRPALLLLAGSMLGAVWQPTAPTRPDAVRTMQLPLELPAVGNLDAATAWRFGRLEDASVDAEGDVRMKIRITDGTVLDVTGPAFPLGQLARRSNWVDPPTKSRPSRTDYAERMVAFSVDANDRIIAMISLEPVARSDTRLRRVFGGG